MRGVQPKPSRVSTSRPEKKMRGIFCNLCYLCFIDTNLKYEHLPLSNNSRTMSTFPAVMALFNVDTLSSPFTWTSQNCQENERLVFTSSASNYIHLVEGSPKSNTWCDVWVGCVKRKRSLTVPQRTLFCYYQNFQRPIRHYSHRFHRQQETHSKYL